MWIEFLTLPLVGRVALKARGGGSLPLYLPPPRSLASLRIDPPHKGEGKP
jgi:hypothetical protein